MRYLFNELLMLRSRAARFTPVYSEERQYAAIGGQDGRGPARSQSVCQSQLAIVGPPRVGRDVRDDDLLLAVGGRAARAGIGTDLDAIYRSHERFWKAGPCTPPQAISIRIKQ